MTQPGAIGIGNAMAAMPNASDPPRAGRRAGLAAVWTMACAMSCIVAAQGPPTLKPSGGPWDAGAGFKFADKEKKTRRSVSGIACYLDAAKQPLCLVAFDEGVEARYMAPRDGTLVVHKQRVMLRTSSGELDAEGAATDGKYLYVTGSHSARRSDCQSNPASRHVIRLRIDPATGRALQGTADRRDSGRLWTILQAQPELQPFVGERQCLGSEPPPDAPLLAGRQGVNIEGLALRNGRLFFGMRGPVEHGVAKVLAVDADALFGQGDPKASVTRIALGERRGIRDMVAAQDGILILAGPDDSPSSSQAGWTIAWWDGTSTTATVKPKVLAALDLGAVEPRACDKEIKPEAVAVLEETSRAYKLLVLSDGMCDGGPLVFDVAR